MNYDLKKERQRLRGILARTRRPPWLQVIGFGNAVDPSYNKNGAMMM
jgi:hypothetical protein